MMPWRYCRSRQDRVWEGGLLPLSNRLGGLGSVESFPTAAWGETPTTRGFFCGATKRIMWHKNRPMWNVLISVTLYIHLYSSETLTEQKTITIRTRKASWKHQKAKRATVKPYLTKLPPEVAWAYFTPNLLLGAFMAGEPPDKYSPLTELPLSRHHHVIQLLLSDVHVGVLCIV